MTPLSSALATSALPRNAVSPDEPDGEVFTRREGHVSRGNRLTMEVDHPKLGDP